ncbi:hypothetical protein EDD16DRAFT_1124695 [Pisolithus croceorrhizus]|nr:hypothetical protein EDD16DRAFT_1124695 [Pisolithus croceorrhizus]
MHKTVEIVYRFLIRTAIEPTHQSPNCCVQKGLEVIVPDGPKRGTKSGVHVVLIFTVFQVETVTELSEMGGALWVVRRESTLILTEHPIAVMDGCNWQTRWSTLNTFTEVWSIKLRSIRWQILYYPQIFCMGTSIWYAWIVHDLLRQLFHR